jgi:hypothetical protein
VTTTTPSPHHAPTRCGTAHPALGRGRPNGRAAGGSDDALKGPTLPRAGAGAAAPAAPSAEPTEPTPGAGARAAAGPSTHPAAAASPAHAPEASDAHPGPDTARPADAPKPSRPGAGTRPPHRTADAPEPATPTDSPADPPKPPGPGASAAGTRTARTPEPSSFTGPAARQVDQPKPPSPGAGTHHPGVAGAAGTRTADARRACAPSRAATGGHPGIYRWGRGGHAQWRLGREPSVEACRPAIDAAKTVAGGDRPSEATEAVLPGEGRSTGDRTWTESQHIGQDTRSGRLAPSMTAPRPRSAAQLSKPEAAESPRGAPCPARDESVTWVVDTVADELFTTWGRLGSRRWPGRTGGRPGTFVPTRSGTATPTASSQDGGLSTYPLPLLRLLASESPRNLIPIGWGQAQGAPFFPASPTLAPRPPRPDGGHDAFQD